MSDRYGGSDIGRALAERTRGLMQRLRRPTYTRDDILTELIDKPYAFYAPGVAGDYAIFIFSSYRCDKYLRGLCTPCHYSGLLHPADRSKAEVFGSVLTQTDHLLAHFDELVLDRQTGDGALFRLERRDPGARFADLQISGEGSFMRDGEIPREIRLEILQKLAAFGREQRIEMHVGLEVKAEDILRAERVGEFEAWGDLVDELHLTLLMGFESADPFVRNVVFCKELETDDVEEAIRVGNRRRMRPTCFVHPGNHSMTDAEVVADARASVDWLRARGAGIYMMLPNLQPHTIPHLLHDQGAHDLLDVRSALPIIDHLIEGGRGDSPVHFAAGDDWRIGGLSSEPDPHLTVLGNPHGVSCARCRRTAEQALHRLARSHDHAAYRAELAALEQCRDCVVAFEADQAEEASRPTAPLPERVADTLDLVESRLDFYAPQPAVLRTGPALPVVC